MSTTLPDHAVNSLLSPFRSALDRAYQMGRSDGINALVSAVDTAKPQKPRAAWGANRGAIRAALRAHGTTNAAEIAAITGIDKPAVSVELANGVTRGEYVRLSPGVYSLAKAEG